MNSCQTPTSTARSARSARSAILVLGLTAAGALAAQDTGVGVDMHYGDELDASGGPAVDQRHPLGMSLLRAHARRTPSGHLYQCPIDYPVAATTGWSVEGSFRIGWLNTSGDEDNSNWRRYTDFDDGPALGFSLRGQERSSGRWFDARGQRIGADAQYFKLRGGSAGRFRGEVSGRSTTNVLSHNARSIWGGVGSNHLTLLGGLQPGASTPAQVAAVSRAQPMQRLQVERDKLGINMGWYLTPRWSVYGQATSEERKGARPFGGPFFFNFPFPDNGGIFETPRPIDDSTINLNTGVRFNGRTWRMDVGYSASLYRDRYVSYDYENPYALYSVVPGAQAITPLQGLFSTEPDNDYHNLRATLGRALPLQGDLAITLSTSRMRQDDELVAPMNCTGFFGIDLAPTGAPANPFLYDCDDWNTTAALSRSSADLEIVNNLLNVRAVVQPNDRLTLRGVARYLQEDYRGTYFAYNPLTGQYGYVAENGAQGAVVPGEMGIVDPVTSITTRIRNLPLDKETMEASVGADLRLEGGNTLGATWRLVRTERSNREYQRVDDNSLRLTWANRALGDLTLRANYQFMDRDGDDYNYDPYHFTFSRSLPGYTPPETGEWPHTVAQMRKYDLASRRQHKANLMATWALGATQTLSGSVRAESNDYDAQIGRQDYDSTGATLQWEWQPHPGTSVSSWLAYDRAGLDMVNVNESAEFFGSPELGGPVYPFEGLWWADDTQRNHNAGIGIDHQWGRVRLGADWNYVRSSGTTEYRFASPLALAWPDLADTTPGRYPTMEYRVNTLTLSASLPLSERISLYVFDTWERGSIADWHYRGLDAQRVYDHRIYTDGGPEDYSTNLLGLFVEVRL